ncbi:magnesium transporter NIPA4 [Purpureocillium lavendulum]|uniref:Magnesium transporter NIPA4 n=1 Tax=Purpureocillium lavendulum TaxID=1247861 RepID=A0AB34G299_9HYPO|nr:magnesium transporter NIPA4 [Purpureocillium lavendulum]
MEPGSSSAEHDSAAAATEPLACVSCRSRKLKCDRTKPACARCLKVGADCAYPESRRKPTFKRRNVKELEARLAQVEEYLNQVNKGGDDAEDSSSKRSDDPPLQMGDFTFESGPPDADRDAQGITSQPQDPFETPSFQDGDFVGNGQLMGLGYSETAPPFEVQEELNNSFFLVQYHFIPVVHSGRYYQAFYGGPLRKPPMCLQYAIWALAANGHAKYDQYCQIFYQRARWAPLIDPRNISTRLPASEEAFASDQEETAPFLDEVFNGATYSGGKPTDCPEDMMEGAWWKRHRELDNKLSNAFMFLPEQLRLPQCIRDPSAVHTNLNLHAAIIALHHAAIEQQELHNLPDSVRQSSLCRLRTSAEEIVNIVKMTSHSTAMFRSPMCALSLYVATTVYVYIAKQNHQSGLTTLDVSNLELIISAMEAVGRQHQITTAFLQQACLDVEKNGLDGTIRLPNLRKYRDIFGGANSNIPMLARSPVSKHTSRSPILPGRLPLNNPKGHIPPSNMRMEKGYPPVTGASRGTEPLVRELINADCFQPLLRAARRNVAARPVDHPGKRKRMSPSPGPGSDRHISNLTSVMTESVSSASQSASTRSQGLGVSNSWRFDGVDLRPHAGSQFFVLPDRTSSSASSPVNREQNTDGVSGSSHTSPGTAGLGNTPEENRFDLRPFQDRIATPLWQTTEEAFFATQIPESLLNLAPGDDDGAWALLNETMKWQDSAAGL